VGYKNILGLIILLSFPVFAQQKQDAGKENYNFSIKQAIDYALGHKDSVLNARLDEKIAAQKMREITGLGLPQVNANAEFDQYFDKPITIVPGSFIHSPTDIAVSFLKTYSTTIGGSFSQLIFDGSYIVGLQAAKTYQQLSTYSTKRTAIDVIASVSKAYYGVVIGAKRIQALDINIEKLKKTYEDTKEMNKQGFVEQLDVQRLEVALNNLEVEKKNSANLISLTMYLLKFQMGMPIDADLSLTDSLPNSFPVPAVETVDYKTRIEYKLVNTQKELNLLDMKRNQFGYFPSLVGFGSLSRNTINDQIDFFGKWYYTGLWGLKLNVPIFDGFQKDARIQQTKLNDLKIQNSMFTLENGINLQVRQASLMYQNNYEALEIQKRNLNLAKEIAHVTTIKYQQGVGTNLELVNAEADLKTAEINYFSALYDLSVAQIDLQKAKGILY